MEDLIIIIELVFIIGFVASNIHYKEALENEERKNRKYSNDLDNALEERDEYMNKCLALQNKLEKMEDKNSKDKTKNENKIKKLSKEYEKLLEKYNIIKKKEDEKETKAQKEIQEGKLKIAIDGKIIDDKIVDITNKQKEIEPLAKKSTKTKKVNSEEKEEKKTTTKRTRKTKKTKE